MYPDGGVSDIQHKQMATQRGENVQVWGVRGNFDDCQTGAKNVFGDNAFATRLLEEHGVALSSANSINWGRLMPQIVYYVSAYAQLVADGKLGAGDELDVCVPTGNFGLSLIHILPPCARLRRSRGSLRSLRRRARRHLRHPRGRDSHTFHASPTVAWPAQPGQPPPGL